VVETEVVVGVGIVIVVVADVVAVVGVLDSVAWCAVVVVGSGGQSPSSMKTSHTRSWAGKGMERLKRVRYQRVP